MILLTIQLWILAKLHAPLWTYLVLALYATLRTYEYATLNRLADLVGDVVTIVNEKMRGKEDE